MKLEEYGRMYALEETHWWYAGMREITAGLLPPSLGASAGNARVLDAGCGTGNNLVHLAERGRTVGVDLSQEALAFCATRGVTVARGSLLALPFADRSFDLVTSFDVLYHRWITDDRRALRELVRVLKPGGFLFVRVPALRILWGAHDEAVYSRHRYTRGELIRLFEDSGLVVRRATYCNSLLFPVLALRRAIDRWARRQGSDVEEPPALVGRIFRALLGLEARGVRHFSFPVGGSVVALGQRPAHDLAVESAHA
jgi:SAM-dependent methyltransferase